MIELKLDRPIDQFLFERNASDYGFGPRWRDESSRGRYHMYVGADGPSLSGDASARLSFSKSGTQVTIFCYSFPSGWEWGWTTMRRFLWTMIYFRRWIEVEQEALDRLRPFLDEHGVRVTQMRRSTVGSPCRTWFAIAFGVGVGFLPSMPAVSELGPWVVPVLTALLIFAFLAYKGRWKTEREFVWSGRTRKERHR
ncbi:MAG: hypothetical protein H6682_23000 [Candidatus Eisenbacteria bacterium]|nr:hypothetical protein [Candidatus Eisenbacteria bacterium]